MDVLKGILNQLGQLQHHQESEYLLDTDNHLEHDPLQALGGLGGGGRSEVGVRLGRRDQVNRRLNQLSLVGTFKILVAIYLSLE